MLSNSLTTPDNEQKHYNIDVANKHCCVKCNSNFNTSDHIPLILDCGHMFCRHCLLSATNNLCFNCVTKTTKYDINHDMTGIFQTINRENTNDCFCDIPISEKLICENNLCQRANQKITCIKCYGLIHAGCEGRYIGDKAVYYISNFYGEHSEMEVSVEVSIAIDCILQPLQIKYNHEDIIDLAHRLYSQWAYTEITKYSINGRFLKDHTIERYVKEDDKYYFINYNMPDIKDGMSIFLKMFTEKLSKMDKDFIKTNSNGILRVNYGYIEKTINCFPGTIRREVQVFVFKMFERIGTNEPLNNYIDILAYDNNGRAPNEIASVDLTSNTGTIYRLICHVFKNSSIETLEQNKKSSCYFIESHYHQTTICVKLLGRGNRSANVVFTGHVHKSEDKCKKHTIRKMNK